MKNTNVINDSNNLPTSSLSRRQFITMTGASLALLSFPMSSAFALEEKKQVGNQAGKPKIVWVLLRGALDSLHTIVPTFDQQYKTLRPKLSSSFKSPLLPLEKGFALHPSLKNLHQWYQEKSLIPVVAVSSGYPKRSHFDGQDYLESGKGEIDHDSGWLARAIEVKNKRALAVSRSTPISLRSSDQVNTWYPSNLKDADEDIYAALDKLYQNDESLRASLESGLEVRGLVGDKKGKKKKRQGKFINLTKACAQLMVGEQGVDCAMLELGGWDTHNNQGSRLNNNLAELDNGLVELKSGLGEEWQNTVVIIGTEFGRTAKENGTGGTDHGTGSALFLAGGAVNGGKVQGSWPGLKTEQLFQQRDLMPTTNSFSWIGNVLSQHWQFTEQELKQVFPHVKPYNQVLLRS
ncbi:MAG TPA: hypothetical protein DIS98_15680 [Colwellia sp.]|nr:hypothetical protein [Colwellia sp.]